MCSAQRSSLIGSGVVGGAKRQFSDNCRDQYKIKTMESPSPSPATTTISSPIALEDSQGCVYEQEYPNSLALSPGCGHRGGRIRAHHGRKGCIHWIETSPAVSPKNGCDGTCPCDDGDTTACCSYCATCDGCMECPITRRCKGECNCVRPVQG